MADINSLQTVADFLNAAGTLGVLLFMVLAFYRGDIVSKRTLDRILAQYERQFAESTARILERIDAALREHRDRGRL